MHRCRCRSFAILGALLLSVLVGCSNSNISSTDQKSSVPAYGPIQIAFVTNNASDYWLIAEAGVNKATQELGPRYSVKFFMPSDSTPAVQEKGVNGLMGLGVKAIAISPVDQESQTPWVNDLCGKVSLITQDSDAPLSKRLAYLGTDNRAAGLLAGKQIKDALPNGGKIALFVGSTKEQNAHDREAGIRDALNGTNIQIVDVLTDNTDHALAVQNAKDAIAKYPDLAMEVGLWSYNGPAIQTAIEELHKIGKVKIVCFDQEMETLAGIEDGEIYATVVQQPYQFGYVATKLLARLAAGDRTEIPSNKIIYFDAQPITKCNIEKYITELDNETNEKWGPS